MRHCIGRPSGASFNARTNCTARDSVSLGMAEVWQANRRDTRAARQRGLGAAAQDPIR
jgi:hypothetical protein